MGKPQVLPYSMTDPYARWARATGFAGMPFQERVPLLIDMYSIGAASRKIWKNIVASDDAIVCALHQCTRYWTAYVKPEHWVALTDALSNAGIRWELGAPYASEATWKLDREFRPTFRIGRRVVGIIDYGCAFAHRQFRAWSPSGPVEPWSTRIAALWDQGANPLALKNRARQTSHPFRLHWRTQRNFGYGAEVVRDDIVKQRDFSALGLDSFIRQFERDGVVDEAACYAHSGYAPLQTASATHGTFVMDLAAGWPDPLLGLGGSPGDVPEHDIVFVQLPRFFNGVQVSGLLRTYVLDAVRYIFMSAGQEADVTINLSYGAHAGPHDGSSLLEQALDEAIAQRRQLPSEPATHIVIASGNGHEERSHARQVIAGRAVTSLGLDSIPDNPTDQFVEVWLDAEDVTSLEGCKVRLVPPGAKPRDIPLVGIGAEWSLGDSPGEQAMVIAARRASQSPSGRMVLLAFAPTTVVRGRRPSPYGRWTLEVHNSGRAPVRLNAWCERDEPVFGSASGPRQIRFSVEDACVAGMPSSQGRTPQSLNSMGHGRNTIIVGGLVGGSRRLPGYVGRGPGRGETTSRYPAAPASPGKPPDCGKPGPEWLALAEESDALAGLAAAGVYGYERVRLNGTSAAAARATRHIAAKKPMPPPSCTVDVDGDARIMPCVPDPQV
jgi:hypothetical protein